MAMTKECAICGATFTPDVWHKYALTCSRACSKKLEYRKHRARYIARSVQWNKAHPERFRRNLVATHNRRPEHYRAMWRLKEQRRNARMREVGGRGLTSGEWLGIIAAQRGMCWWCGERRPLQIDHVIPVSKCGRHEPENIVASCCKCNTQKGDRLWPYEGGAVYWVSKFLGWNGAGLTNSEVSTDKQV